MKPRRPPKQGPRNSKSSKAELEKMKRDLKAMGSQGLRKLYELLSPDDVSPVDLGTFLDDKQYLGDYFSGGFLSLKDNYWRKALEEIFPANGVSPYWLCCLKGAIGAGKTTAACAGMLYDLHRLLCYGNPQEALDVIPTDKIEFAIFNVTKALAQDVVWDKIKQMFSSSAYFTKLKEEAKQTPQGDTLFPKRINFFRGSRLGHSLGRSVYEVIIDEANFEIITGQVRANFNSLLRRMQSRYMKIGGGFPGKVWIVSSETDKTSALNQLIDEYRNQRGVFVRQPSLWEARPERCTGKTFKVYIGSDLRPPEIIDAHNASLYEDEPEAIIDVPEEHRSDFEVNIPDALRDLAGISTGSRYKLFRMPKMLEEAMCLMLLFPEVFELDFHDETDQIMNKVLIPEYLRKGTYPKYPRYIHIDIGLTRDRLGLACSYIDHYEERKRRNSIDFKEMVESVPIIVTEFAFAIQPKGRDLIPLFKVRTFLRWLSGLGCPFAMISADGYESADFLMEMRRQGFPTEEFSVDRTSVPYLQLRDKVHEGLLLLPDSKLLRKELDHLELTPDGSKVIHPDRFPDGTRGSKDLADAVCGSLASVVRNSDKYRMYYSNLTSPQKDTRNSRLKEMFWPDMDIWDAVSRYLYNK